MSESGESADWLESPPPGPADPLKALGPFEARRCHRTLVAAAYAEGSVLGEQEATQAAFDAGLACGSAMGAQVVAGHSAMLLLCKVLDRPGYWFAGTSGGRPAARHLLTASVGGPEAFRDSSEAWWRDWAPAALHGADSPAGPPVGPQALAQSIHWAAHQRDPAAHTTEALLARYAEAVPPVSLVPAHLVPAVTWLLALHPTPNPVPGPSPDPRGPESVDLLAVAFELAPQGHQRPNPRTAHHPGPRPSQTPQHATPQRPETTW